VFDSISKQGYKGVAANDFYLRNEQKPLQVIALGGIDAQHIQPVTNMNFDGAALLGAIWGEPENAIENFKLCKQHVHTY
jgi:thiamine-phosphate pyrophosphorylase